MKKKITIIVPVYNVEDYIDRCIKSLVQQTYRELEILLVNDGSKDSSAAKCHKWALEDGRIRVIDKKNGGLSDARNAGINEATGEYLLFIDSDDFVKEEMVEEMLSKLEQEQAEICVCDMEYYYDDGHTEFSQGGEFKSSSVEENPKLIQINNSACNKLFVASLFKEIRFPLGKVYEDLATIPKVLFEAKKVVKVNKPLYVYYQRAGSIAHTASKKIFDIYDAIFSCIKYMEEKNASKEVMEELYHMYVIHGLDLTTIRIKNFDDHRLIEEYLRENMKYLRKHYPEYRSDKLLKSMSWKKKMIFKLMDMGQMKVVKKLYGK